MNDQQITGLVRQAYADFASGDLAHLLSYMAPQVEWETPTLPGFSFTGMRRGTDQVAEYFRLAGEQRAMREFAPREFIAEGDKVVVLGYCAWTALTTGVDFESDWVHVFRIEDGRIAAFREFMDAHVALAALRAAVPAGAG